jgi:hypothetical protein
LVERRIALFDLSARLFPLDRTRRLAGAYARMVLMEPVTTQDLYFWLRRAAETDHNSADIWYGLVHLDLNSGNKRAYTADMVELRKLTPHIVQHEVTGTSEGRP